MLPEFFSIKKKINEKLISPYIRTRQSYYLGFLNQIRQRKIHEGESSLIIRSESTEDRLEPKPMSGGYSTNKIDIKDMTPVDVLEKMDGAVKEMCDEISDGFISMIESTCEQTGNVVNSNKKFSVDDFLELLGQIEIDFDDNGNPVWPSIIVGDGGVTIAEELKKIERDTTVQKRFETIVNRKREEYHARESNRELVG